MPLSENFQIFVKILACCALCGPVRAATFPVSHSTGDSGLESESRSLTHGLSHFHINHQHQLDAPKYYKLNELLYKSRPRSTDEQENSYQARALKPTSDSRPLDEEAPQVGAPRRANADEDESSIDSLIREMQQQRNTIGRNQDSKTGVTYDGTSARRDMLGGARPAIMDSSIGGYDEAAVQRKSTNSLDDDASGLDEASARLRTNGKSIGSMRELTFKAKLS